MNKIQSACWLLALILLPATAMAQETRYTDRIDGTVVDKVTGLVWQSPASDTQQPWRDALAYCEALDLAGHDDWRVPDIRELRSLVDVAATSPAIDADAFPGTSNNGYWSSTTRFSSPNFAFYILFGSGYVYTYPKTANARVRCVRHGG